MPRTVDEISKDVMAVSAATKRLKRLKQIWTNKYKALNSRTIDMMRKLQQAKPNEKASVLEDAVSFLVNT